MTAPSLEGTSILIVEDNFVVADALKYLITVYEGSVAAIAPTVERALEALAAAPVDVAVLDINLKGQSVVPLADHLQAQGIPFLFVTGYADAQMLPERLREHPRLDKPVDAERLVLAIRNLTHARR